MRPALLAEVADGQLGALVVLAESVREIVHTAVPARFSEGEDL
jgi:hypothetical protein